MKIIAEIGFLFQIKKWGLGGPYWPRFFLEKSLDWYKKIPYCDEIWHGGSLT